jgi:hypothetical protein
MIPQDNPKTYPYLRTIAKAIEPAYNATVGTGVRFYVLDVNEENMTITATFHVCCGCEADEGMLSYMKNMFSSALMNRLNMKVIWE